MTFYPEKDSHAANGEGYGDSVFTKMIKAGHRTYFIDVTLKKCDFFFLSTDTWGPK